MTYTILYNRIYGRDRVIKKEIEEENLSDVMIRVRKVDAVSSGSRGRNPPLKPHRLHVMSRGCQTRSKRKCEVEELNRISTSMQLR